MEYKDPADLEEGKTYILDLHENCYYQQLEVTIRSTHEKRRGGVYYHASGLQGHRNTFHVPKDGHNWVRAPTGRFEVVEVLER